MTKTLFNKTVILKAIVLILTLGLSFEAWSATNETFVDIKFRLDDARIDTAYMDNATAMNRLAAVIDSIGRENLVSVKAVSVSSPEGPYWYNKRLSMRRQQAVLEYLNREFPEYENLITTDWRAESWEDLATFVAADQNLSAENIEKVLKIVNSTKFSDKRKKDFYTLGYQDGLGNIYRYLYKSYYQYLRYSGIVVVSNGNVALAPLACNIKPLPTDSLQGPQLSILDIQQSAVASIDDADSKVREPMLSVKTNMLYNAFFYPGVGMRPIWNGTIEYYPRHSEHWTFLAEVEMPWWSNYDEQHYCFQIRNYQLEARRYFASDRKHNGLYLSAYTMSNLYDICLDLNKGRGRQGEGYGAGLGVGYVLPISKNGSWKLEFLLKAGYYESRYDSYHAGRPFAGKYYYDWTGDAADFKPRNWRLRWFGPTGVGISLSYDLLSRKVK